MLQLQASGLPCHVSCPEPWPLFLPRWLACWEESQATCAIYRPQDISSSSPLWSSVALPTEWQVHPPPGSVGACAAGGLSGWSTLPPSVLHLQHVKTSCAKSWDGVGYLQASCSGAPGTTPHPWPTPILEMAGAPWWIFSLPSGISLFC